MGAFGGSGDWGAIGMLPCGTGGGGTSGATGVLDSGGDSSAVLIVICGGAFGFSLEGMDTLRC